MSLLLDSVCLPVCLRYVMLLRLIILNAASDVFP